jgi:hypothetical protein
MAAVSTYVKNSTMGSVTLADSTGTPVTLALAYDKGDLAISGLGAKLNDVSHIQRRGKHVCSVFGARRYPQVTLSIFVSNLVGGSTSAPGSMLEFVTLLNAYVANTNPQGTGRPAAFKLTYTIEGSNFGDSADETVALASLTLMSMDFAEAIDGNTLTMTCECAGSIVITNSTGVVTLAEIS